VASAIVRAALAWAAEQGHHVMRLHASRMGRGVYERFGFERSWEMRLDWSRRPRGRRAKPSRRAR
jgi:GNAT superfamily N-acetyltransferase